MPLAMTFRIAHISDTHLGREKPYFTANFLDMFGNATNISARIQGTRGGRYLLATTDWEGKVPPGATVPLVVLITSN